MAIRTKNLNLIPILQALLREQSVSGAAFQAGLSQPAMSGALGRLRELLDDPLLVRVGRSMQLTPRASALRKQIDDLCAQIEILFQPESFEPARSEAKFRVAAPDYLAFALSGPLLNILAAEAPGIRVDFFDMPGDIPHCLEESMIDLVVCADLGEWTDLRREFLFRERYVAVVAENHPLAGRDLVSSEELSKYPSPSLNYEGIEERHPRGRRWVTGIPSLDYMSQVSSMSQLNSVMLAATPPMVARGPITLVDRLRGLLPLVAIELSDDESSFDTTMFWTAVTEEAAEHLWLRSVIRRILFPGGAPTEANPRGGG